MHSFFSPVQKMEEERTAHEQKLAKMEAEMRAVFQAKVQEKEQKLKHSEEEASDPMKTCCIEFSYAYPFFYTLQLYARHKQMKEALEKQRLELEEKKRRLESGRPITPEKAPKKRGFTFNK